MGCRASAVCVEMVRVKPLEVQDDASGLEAMEKLMVVFLETGTMLAAFREGGTVASVRTPESWSEQTFSSLPSRRLVLQRCAGLKPSVPSQPDVEVGGAGEEVAQWSRVPNTGKKRFSSSISKVSAWTSLPFTPLPTLSKSWSPVLKAEL